MNTGDPSRRPLVLPPPKASKISQSATTSDSQVQHVKSAILAPYYQVISIPEEQHFNGHDASVDTVADTGLSPSHPAPFDQELWKFRGTKRKAEDEKSIGESSSNPVPPRSPTQYTTTSVVRRTSSRILEQLKRPNQHDTIQECGEAVLSVLERNPTVALDRAYQKLYTWPYHEVPLCWRRLYEDASLYKALQILMHELEMVTNDKVPSDEEAWRESVLGSVVRTLDFGFTLSGAPFRASLFEDIFKDLVGTMPVQADQDTAVFPIDPLKLSKTSYAVPRHDSAMDFIEFQEHLDNHAIPIIIPDVIAEWPALERWRRPSYLMRHTLNGHRLVPVEIGKSYIDDDWSQKMMPMREFMNEYLLPANPPEIAYLAQHDLFKQIPTLRDDISIPDYCYTVPPAPDAGASKTAGLSDTAKLATPLLNAWLGPTGTKTPLHTDPYHNILSQVVGYKYVRLYAPSETSKVYPRGVDGSGVSMENTSSVDIQRIRPDLCKGERESLELIPNQQEPWERTMQEFPLLQSAQYFEAVLGPGECLYIPLGWWHYAESVSTSFSVSFWWN